MLRYREIKSELKNLITNMNDGERLPSRLALCKQLDTSRATVDKAIRELEEDGFLESRMGSGTYVARRMKGVVANISNWCLIVPDISEGIYAKMASSVEHVAHLYGANIILCNSENSAEKQSEYIERLVTGGVDGFIIVPVITKNVIEGVALYQSLIQSKIPFVFCNRDVEGIKAPLVKSNDFYGGYLATLHLLECGYKNIAYLSMQCYRTSVERCQGYISALQQKGKPIVRKNILMLDDGTMEDCYEKLIELIKSDVSVDAVFCFNDAIAIEAMRAIEAMDLRISDDIGVIGYDSINKTDDTKIPLTSVAYQIEEVGEFAARVLKKKIDNKEKGNFEYYLINPHIVVRDSCLGKYEIQERKLQNDAKKEK